MEAVSWATLKGAADGLAKVASSVQARASFIILIQSHQSKMVSESLSFWHAKLGPFFGQFASPDFGLQRILVPSLRFCLRAPEWG